MTSRDFSVRDAGGTADRVVDHSVYRITWMTDPNTGCFPNWRGDIASRI